MSAKKLGLGSLVGFALLGATTAHASPQRAAAHISKPVTQRSLLALSTQPTSLVQVARTPAAIAAVRAQGATLVSPQLNVWSLRSGAAQVLGARLARRGELRAAEPNRTLRLQGRLDAGDPLLPQEWWMHAVGADAAVPPGPGRPITVVDAGLDMTHPEFSSRPNTSVFNTQTTVGDVDFHGTAVSSVAAAPANGVGVVGIYPEAVLRAWDASPAGEITLSGEVKGITTAAAAGPTVINLSLGSNQFSGLEKQAVAYAFGRGSLVVAAAGNGGARDPQEFPASLPHVLTVAATTEQGVVADFSSASEAIDLAAPGVDIPVAVPQTFDPSGYRPDGAGTSFAAPIVTGAAAWVATQRPTLDVTQLFQVMRRSAVDVAPAGWDLRTGYGQLNVPAALALPTPASDPQEPNEDIVDVRAKGLFAQGHAPLTTRVHRSASIKAMLDVAEDPEDIYRVVVPPKRTLTATLRPSANTFLWLWGPKTGSVLERPALRKRDLLSRSEKPGKATQVVRFRNRTKLPQTLYVDAWLDARHALGTVNYSLSIVSR